MKCRKNSPLACLGFSHGLGIILVLISDCRRCWFGGCRRRWSQQDPGAGMVVASSPQPMTGHLVARSTSSQPIRILYLSLLWCATSDHLYGGRLLCDVISLRVYKIRYTSRQPLTQAFTSSLIIQIYLTGQKRWQVFKSVESARDAFVFVIEIRIARSLWQARMVTLEKHQVEQSRVLANMARRTVGRRGWARRLQEIPRWLPGPATLYGKIGPCRLRAWMDCPMVTWLVESPTTSVRMTWPSTHSRVEQILEGGHMWHQDPYS